MPSSVILICNSLSYYSSYSYSYFHRALKSPQLSSVCWRLRVLEGHIESWFSSTAWKNMSWLDLCFRASIAQTGYVVWSAKDDLIQPYICSISVFSVRAWHGEVFHCMLWWVIVSSLSWLEDFISKPQMWQWICNLLSTISEKSAAILQPEVIQNYHQKLFYARTADLLIAEYPLQT